MWKKMRFDELFVVGSAKRVLKSQWKNEGVPFYRGREVTKLSMKGSVNNQLFITKGHYIELKKKYGVPNVGDIIMTAIGTIGNAYIVKQNDEFYFKDASVLWLKKTSNILSKYVNYFIKSDLFKSQLDSGNGATVDTLTIKKLASIEIEVPPLNEQQKIITKLDGVFAEIDKAINIKNKKINNIISLNKKIIDNHFLKFKKEILFNEIVLEKGTGLERSKRLQSTDKAFPYLKMNNINKDNQINVKKFVSVDAKKEEIKKYSLKKGDFLFNTRNSVELVGKSAVFNEEGTWLFNNNILRVKFKSEFLSKFINFFLLTTLGKTYLEEMKTGTTNVAAIYYKNLATLKIPLTSVETQEKTVKNIESVFNHTSFLIKKFNKNILNLESLKWTILSNELTNNAQ